MPFVLWLDDSVLLGTAGGWHQVGAMGQQSSISVGSQGRQGCGHQVGGAACVVWDDTWFVVSILLIGQECVVLFVVWWDDSVLQARHTRGCLLTAQGAAEQQQCQGGQDAPELLHSWSASLPALPTHCPRSVHRTCDAQLFCNLLYLPPLPTTPAGSTQRS
jgi:hypothetical protein